MSDLVLEHLRHIRSRVDSIDDKLTDVQSRMQSLESSMLLVKREVSHGDETSVRQQVSLDRLVARVERIERRLELTD